MIGDRVRHARTYHGWSQRQLADLTKVKQPYISQVENGGPASEELVDSVARETQFTRDFFDRGRLPDLPQGSLRFRKRSTARVRDDERIRAHVRQAIEVLNDLERVAAGPPVQITPIDPTTQSPSHLDIEHIAAEYRELLGIGPLDPIPNLVRAVERAGVVVIGSSQEIEKHEGATYWPECPSGRPIICVSRGRPGDKMRLSVAHELGHLVLHQFRRSPDPATIEPEAFRFAGALLLPIEAAFDSIERPVTLRQLAMVKARYGISIAALVKRCLDIGLIDADRRTSLEKQISARHWRKNEPVHVPEEQPTLMRRVVELATGTTKPNQLHRRLGLPPLAIRDLLG